MPSAARIAKSEEALSPAPVFSQAIISKGMAYSEASSMLKAANSGMEHVVKCNIYITDLKDFGAMNEVYAEFFPKDMLPARTCVVVAALSFNAAVEFECVAEVVESSW
ncbi:Endoribonuclease L-PSP/chorismate mutase-like protein [Coprinopsis sp. MPI-PUGE-AT-0042]|nr:Endoribonuclease L-PSP/chorismate mutase-like protein [Coprinopsis sp. MPI-PUGE-AT-0042]